MRRILCIFLVSFVVFERFAEASVLGRGNDEDHPTDGAEPLMSPEDLNNLFFALMADDIDDQESFNRLEQDVEEIILSKLLFEEPYNDEMNIPLNSTMGDVRVNKMLESFCEPYQKKIVPDNAGEKIPSLNPKERSS